MNSETMVSAQQNISKAFLGLLRIAMGFVFLWAFLDKTFGLGFATSADKSWLSGGSPTAGFLQFGVHGPFASFYNSLASIEIVEWMFMLGLLFVGLSLILGICVRLATFFGALMFLLMYGAVGLPPENNPFIDDHIIYMLVMGLLAFGNAGKYFGFGNKWYNTALVQKYKFLA
jgi:thiosulfate dehydrogenase (quinone) large subunit